MGGPRFHGRSQHQQISKCKHRHRHQEYLSFIKHVDENVPRHLDVHVVVDNYATHTHPSAKRGLATHPRWYVHYTPTSASWLNQVGIWLNIITQRAIRRGSFTSVKELIRKIDAYVVHHNAKSRPFAWTATADSILGKIERLCQRISESGYLVHKPTGYALLHAQSTTT